MKILWVAVFCTIDLRFKIKVDVSKGVKQSGARSS